MGKIRKITGTSGRVYGYTEEPIILTQSVDAPLFGNSQDDIRAGLESLKRTVGNDADALKQRYGLNHEQLEHLKPNSQLEGPN